MGLRTDDVDQVRRSYAVLGLRPGAALPDVRRRYRFLAQRWHPDRHAGDARNQAEAGAEMRRINDAYQAIVESRAGAPAATVQGPSPTRRLSPEEIDALARAIGSESPVDWALSTVGWVGSTVDGILGILCAIGLAVRLVVGLWRGDFTVLREHPEVILLLLTLVVLGVREVWVRVRIGRPTSQLADS